MTFLVVKIFVYLLVALAMGGVAGWLLRRAQSPQAEAAGIDQAQIIGLEQQVAAAQAELDEQAQVAEAQAASMTSEIEAHERTIQALQEALDEARAAQPDEESDSLIAALHNEIARLRSELTRREQVRPRNADELERTIKELEARLLRKAAELDRLEQALNREERKNKELERERELQNKSLHVLHQQLELERESPKAVSR